jgi:endonuclease V-like protein UPF0215 family
MKKQIRLIGIDDSPFSFSDRYCIIIGVIMRGNGYIEGILREEISVDGDDATINCINMINNNRHRSLLKSVLLDGVTFGGFNVIDIHKIYDKTSIPVITITRDKPDYYQIKHALENNFQDWTFRLEIIKKGKIHEIKTKHNPIYIKYVGIDLDEAKEIINISTIRGVIPEPIRVAHLIASGIKRGESYGKA